MQNPFESGHIKNYLILYASVVVIVILFFIASTLFYDVKDVEKKVFNTEVKEAVQLEKIEKKVEHNKSTSRFKLMNKAY